MLIDKGVIVLYTNYTTVENLMFLCYKIVDWGRSGWILSEENRIGSDLDPNGNLWIWIGSRSNFSSLDRIGSNSKKIGAEYITGKNQSVL